MTDAQKPSLRTRLLHHVMWPLALTWLLGTAVAAITANFFTEQAFDRALLDDAYSVAANVRQQREGLELVLTPREVSAVLFDQVETVLFAVTRPDGSLLAGHAGLHPPPLAAGVDHAFADIGVQGRTFRAVTVQRQEPFAFVVVMAQTTQSRNALLNRLLLYAIGPQVLLLALLAWWLRRAIQNDLQPLAQLQQAVDQRDASDLTPVVVSASSRDVSRLGSAVNSLLLRLGDSIRAQREFAGNVAHELRTPLAGIRALADYGLAQHKPEIWHEQLQRIATSQTRASHLVDQLLALALADETGALPQMVPLRLVQVVRNAVLRYLPRADAAGADLGASGLDTPVTVVGNEALIEGMLNNLVDNALRYGRTGEPGSARITVALAREADGVVLSVSDEGPGVPADAQQGLRQRWAQGAAGERLGQGAGLGLAIVSRYAELMHARFVLASGPNGIGLHARLVFSL
ncbi:MAG: sensor histidine kinase N-terminal domain-containing protein [Microbacteriaceae bacterium]|nr:sensor histidine kinase N-terminal domain-containing protein [Burkholderiaceae bacterium]